MIGFRTLTLLALTATTVVGAADRTWFGSGSGAALLHDTAWALLAEAEELCRSNHEPGERSETSRSVGGSVARPAIAREALEIVRELSATVGEPSERASLLGALERIERQCASGARLSNAAGPKPGGASQSLDGSGSRERNVLLEPYLERLNEAANRSLGAVADRSVAVGSERVARATSRPASFPSPKMRGQSKSSANDETDSAPRSAPRVKEAREIESTKPIEPPAIVIGRATREHRERVERWSVVFRREAGALRRSRRLLQVEIESHTVARSRRACRAFGSTVARLDSDFVHAAPSRGLSLRISRMVNRYRRGMALCEAGRSTAAFAYLNEGDREWALVAQIAARMFEPRPLAFAALSRARRPPPAPVPDGI